LYVAPCDDPRTVRHAYGDHPRRFAQLTLPDRGRHPHHLDPDGAAWAAAVRCLESWAP
jgi:hypothetical protein